MQVKVATAEPVAPSGDAALTRVPASASSTSAAARAARLLARYGDGVLEAIDADPQRRVPRGRAEPDGARTRRSRSWHGLRSTRALHLLLAPHGLAWLVPRIAQGATATAAHRVVRERPYELTSVFGVGFQIADTIARAGGRRRRRPARTRAARRPRARRGRARRLDVPAGRRARGAARRRCSAGRRRRRAARATMAERRRSWCSRSTTTRRGPTGRRPAALEAELARADPRLAGGRDGRASRRPAGAATTDLVPGAGAGGGGARGVRAPALDRHRRPGHRQDGDDPADLRGRRGAGRDGRCWSRRPAAPRGGWPSRPGVEASTIHSALGWVPGQGPTVDELDAPTC